MEERYYRILGKKAHKGAKRGEEKTFFIKAPNINAAMDAYNFIPGNKPTPLARREIHDHALKHRGGYIPNITELSEEEVRILRLRERLRGDCFWIEE